MFIKYPLWRFLVSFLENKDLFWMSMGLLFWKSGKDPSELVKVCLTCTVRCVRMRSICRQTLSKVHSVQMADLHSFDLMWPGQSLIDMCTGILFWGWEVTAARNINTNSFEWRKWLNPHLFEHCFHIVLATDFIQTLNGSKDFELQILYYMVLLSFTVIEILEF